MSDIQRKKQKVTGSCSNCGKNNSNGQLRCSCSSTSNQNSYTEELHPEHSQDLELIIHQISELKRKVNLYQSKHHLRQSTSELLHHKLEENQPLSQVRINFYEGYNSLAMKKSCHEDHKPLDIIANHKKDPYLIFSSYYMLMVLKLNEEAIRKNWKGETVTGMSKWTMLIDINDKDSDLKDVVYLLNSDRSKLLRKVKCFPLLTSNSSSDEDLLFIRTEIERILPCKEVSTVYLNYFFSKIYNFRPWIDETQFRQDISNIISYDGKIPKIKIFKRADLAIISTYLIILRYTYITTQVMKSQDSFDHKLQMVLENPVPVEFITTAQLALSYYRALRKTSLEIVQALLYLRIYFRDCPEDGDSVRLTQSQNLMGLIVQSAVSIGLNSDPKNYDSILKNSPYLIPLRRRIWYSIIEMDSRSAALSGSITALPEKSYWKVDYPDESFSKNFILDDLYLKMSKLINNVHQDVELSELNSLIEKTDEHINTYFSLDAMVSIEYLNPNSKHFHEINLQNTKILSTHLVNLAFKAQVFIAILLHFENKKESFKL